MAPLRYSTFPKSGFSVTYRNDLKRKRYSIGVWVVRKKIVTRVFLAALSIAALKVIADYTIEDELKPIPSPNREKMIIFEKDAILTFRIIGKDGMVEETIISHASRVMRWGLRWDGDDRIALTSSDIGDRAWRFDRSAGWVEEKAAPANIPEHR
jgi:hypothetical protein